MARVRLVAHPARPAVRTWDVRFARRGELPRGWLGCCDHEARLILIRRSLDGPERRATAIHEALHAALPDIGEEAIQRAEEAVVDVLAALDRLT